MIKKYLDFKEAVKKSLNIVENTKLKEIVNLENSLGRVLSEDIFCVKNLPSFNNSAMDGFAVKAEDAGKKLNVKKTIYAGANIEACLENNECYKIMTGAKVPSDVDTIIPIEDVLFYENNEVQLKNELKKGACLRLKGEEQKEGNILFSKGEKVTSSIIAVLASQGLIMINVFKKLSIAVVSTGDELKEPWENASVNEIYNCNSFALISILKEHGFYATYTGVIPDDLDASQEFVKNLKSYDVVITSGGISMGDADFVGQAFLNNGLDIAFHGVNIKPGRPIMMGNMKNTLVICLPGNPLTAMVNIHLFALPVLNKLQGSSYIYHDIEVVKNKEEFKTKKGRVNVVLGSVKEGNFNVTQKNKYGSGMISVLSLSNSILVTNEDKDLIKAESNVNVIRFKCEFLRKSSDIFN